jgi:DNA helicase-2/ATP-dependent DNA helicase PcrA
MVVGDDDQSIYRFQGANIENMLDFSTHYPETKFIVLENNYRSHQDILNISSRLIGNNSERIVNKIPNLEKKLISSISETAIKPKLLKANSEIEEKAFILKTIQDKIKN